MMGTDWRKRVAQLAGIVLVAVCALAVTTQSAHADGTGYCLGLSGT